MKATMFVISSATDRPNLYYAGWDRIERRRPLRPVGHPGPHPRLAPGGGRRRRRPPARPHQPGSRRVTGRVPGADPGGPGPQRRRHRGPPRPAARWPSPTRSAPMAATAATIPGSGTSCGNEISQRYAVAFHQDEQESVPLLDPTATTAPASGAWRWGTGREPSCSGGSLEQPAPARPETPVLGPPSRRAADRLPTRPNRLAPTSSRRSGAARPARGRPAPTSSSTTGEFDDHDRAVDHDHHRTSPTTTTEPPTTTTTTTEPPTTTTTTEPPTTTTTEPPADHHDHARPGHDDDDGEALQGEEEGGRAADDEVRPPRRLSRPRPARTPPANPTSRRW